MIQENNITPLQSIRFNQELGTVERPHLILETRTGQYIADIQYTDLSVSLVGKGLDEISFDVHKYVEGKEVKCWEKMRDLTIVHYVGYGRFEADFTLNDSDETIKSCQCVSLEAELGQRLLREFHVNDDVATVDGRVIRTYDSSKGEWVETNLDWDKSTDPPKFIPTVLYNPDDTTHSLLNRCIEEKAPRWKIGYVSNFFKVGKKVYHHSNLQREFTVDGTSIYDFLEGAVCQEMGCVFQYDTLHIENGVLTPLINCYNLEECVYDTDTMDVVEDAYYKDGVCYYKNGVAITDKSVAFCTGVGNDTQVFMSKNKLIQTISLNSDKDSVKNCFYVSGGDDVMTSTVAAANVTGNNYIYNFADFQYDDMSNDLVYAIQGNPDGETEEQKLGYNAWLEKQKLDFYADGGVYIWDSSKHYVYDEQTKTCRTSYEDGNKVLTDAIYMNNKVWVLDPLAYKVGELSKETQEKLDNAIKTKKDVESKITKITNSNSNLDNSAWQVSQYVLRDLGLMTYNIEQCDAWIHDNTQQLSYSRDLDNLLSINKELQGMLVNVNYEKQHNYYNISTDVENMRNLVDTLGHWQFLSGDVSGYIQQWSIINKYLKGIEGYNATILQLKDKIDATQSELQSLNNQLKTAENILATVFPSGTLCDKDDHPLPYTYKAGSESITLDGLWHTSYPDEITQGLYVQYEQALDRYYYLKDGKFPDVYTDANTTAKSVYDDVVKYFWKSNGSTEDYKHSVYVTSSWDKKSFSHITSMVEKAISAKRYDEDDIYPDKCMFDTRYDFDIVKEDGHKPKILSVEEFQKVIKYHTQDGVKEETVTLHKGIWRGYIEIHRTVDETDAYPITADGVKEYKELRVQIIQSSGMDDDLDYCKQKLDFAIADTDIKILDLSTYLGDDWGYDDRVIYYLNDDIRVLTDQTTHSQSVIVKHLAYDIIQDAVYNSDKGYWEVNGNRVTEAYGVGIKAGIYAQQIEDLNNRIAELQEQSSKLYNRKLITECNNRLKAITPYYDNAKSDLYNYFIQYNATTLNSYADAFDSCLTSLLSLKDGLTDGIQSDSLDIIYSKYVMYQSVSEEAYYYMQEKVNDIDIICKQLSADIFEFRQSVALQNWLTKYYGNHGYDLWNELQAYIREDNYDNGNYISDGLTDSEILTKARELLDVANDELKKACVLQHTVSGDIHNIFSVEELKQICMQFSLFNYVRCRIDEKIYKLRLMQIDFDENTLDSINVTFSDQVESVDGTVSDLESIVSQSSAIATTYDATVRQAADGSEAQSTFNNIKQEGLNSALYEIKNSNSEEVTLGRDGLLARAETDIGVYDPHQLRITKNGVWLTDDAWQSVRSAFGMITYNGERKYGLIADVVCGDLIAGENLQIMNSGNTVTIDGKGIHLSGSQAIDFSNGANVPQDAVDGLVQKFNEQKEYIDEIQEDLQNQIDGEITSWFGKENPTKNNYPANQWTTEQLKKDHISDLYYNTATGQAFKYTAADTWSSITDSKVKDALEQAAKAQDTADGKRRTFSVQPVPPYDEGDLWCQGSSGDILVCKSNIHREKGSSYVADDWILASNYIDSNDATTISTTVSQSEIGKFQQNVLGATSTTITGKQVISPYLGGGYLYISKSGRGSVEINPDNIATGLDGSDGSIFSIKNKNGKEVIGMNTDGSAKFYGNGEFSGYIKAESEINQYESYVIVSYNGTQAEGSYGWTNKINPYSSEITYENNNMNDTLYHSITSGYGLDVSYAFASNKEVRSESRYYASSLTMIDYGFKWNTKTQDGTYRMCQLSTDGFDIMYYDGKNYIDKLQLHYSTSIDSDNIKNNSIVIPTGGAIWKYIQDHCVLK